MSKQPIETLEVQNRQAWREWLKEHYDNVSEIWLVFYKRHTGITVTDGSSAKNLAFTARFESP